MCSSLTRLSPKIDVLGLAGDQRSSESSSRGEKRHVNPFVEEQGQSLAGELHRAEHDQAPDPLQQADRSAVVSAADFSDLAGLHFTQSALQVRHQRDEKLDLVASRHQHHDGDGKAGDRLLIA